VSDPAARSFRVYAGHVQTATATTWWLDDVAILALDNAVANVIRTTITDFVLRPAGQPRNSSSVFISGVDYAIHAAEVNVTGTGNFRDKTNTSRLDASLLSSLHASSGGKISPGAKLWVDYDFQPGSMGFHTYVTSLLSLSFSFSLSFFLSLSLSLSDTRPGYLQDLWRGLTGKVKWIHAGSQASVSAHR
jgi:hypothetical protein